MVDLYAANPKVDSLEAGDRYDIGKIGVLPKLTILVKPYPLYSLGTGLFLVLLFAWGSLRALKAVKASRK